jgi:hypothetical protein
LTTLPRLTGNLEKWSAYHWRSFVETKLFAKRVPLVTLTTRPLNCIFMPPFSVSPLDGNNYVIPLPMACVIRNCAGFAKNSINIFPNRTVD